MSVVELGRSFSEDRMTIAIDFDGTVVLDPDEVYGKFMGLEKEYICPLKEGAKEVINELYNLANVVIYTCRGDTEPVREYLMERGVKFDTINENPIQPETISKNKIFADIYIDNRNLFFVDDWSVIRNEVLKRLCSLYSSSKSTHLYRRVLSSMGMN